MRAGRLSYALLLLPLVAAAQNTGLQIQVLEGEGAHHLVGARAAKFLTVKVSDDLGKPVPGAVVSFRLPEDGPSGLFANGLPTEVVTTSEDGLASAPGVRWSSAPGAFEIRVVAVAGGARAGTVVPAYLSEGGGNGLDAGRIATTLVVRQKPRRRWLTVGLVAAGAAALGLTAGLAGGSQPEAPKLPEPPRIGAPIISIGRP